MAKAELKEGGGKMVRGKGMRKKDDEEKKGCLERREERAIMKRGREGYGHDERVFEHKDVFECRIDIQR